MPRARTCSVASDVGPTSASTVMMPQRKICWKRQNLRAQELLSVKTPEAPECKNCFQLNLTDASLAYCIQPRQSDPSRGEKIGIELFPFRHQNLCQSYAKAATPGKVYGTVSKNMLSFIPAARPRDGQGQMTEHICEAYGIASFKVPFS